MTSGLRGCVLTLLTFLIAVGPAYAQARACTSILENFHVRGVMKDYYLWYKEVPSLNPGARRTPEAYLDAVRYRPLDQTFTYITSEKENQAFYGESQFVGFGFSTLLTASGELRVTQVFADSPADRGGLRRGDRIVDVDDRPLGDIIAAGALGTIFGAADIGVRRTIGVARSEGTLRVQMAKAMVTIPTVSLTRTIDVDGRRVGYIFFRNFVTPSVDALNAAFAELQRSGATELVLDLRYNGGGLVSVAQHLASLIGGARTNGQVFAEYVHNDRHQALNHVVRFEATPNALTLSRVIVISTRATASASELVANALRPFMPVVLIGDRTYGKPVGQYSFTFCQKVLAAVSFSLRNAAGQGDYFDGLPPTCRVDDDVDHQLGELEERLLAEALVVIRTGACSPPLLHASNVGTSRAATKIPEGWSALIGAN